MECEAPLGEQTIGVSPLTAFSLAKKNQKRKGENYNICHDVLFYQF